jgi:hypothetical protein
MVRAFSKNKNNQTLIQPSNSRFLPQKPAKSKQIPTKFTSRAPKIIKGKPINSFRLLIIGFRPAIIIFHQLIFFIGKAIFTIVKSIFIIGKAIFSYIKAIISFRLTIIERPITILPIRFPKNIAPPPLATAPITLTKFVLPQTALAAALNVHTTTITNSRLSITGCYTNKTSCPVSGAACYEQLTNRSLTITPYRLICPKLTDCPAATLTLLITFELNNGATGSIAIL